MADEISPIIVIDRFEEMIRLLREISAKLGPPPTPQTPEIVVQPPEVTVRPEVKFPSLTTRFLRQIDEKHFNVTTDRVEEYDIPQYTEGVTVLIYSDVDIYISFINPISPDAFMVRAYTPYVVDIIGHQKLYLKAKDREGNAWVQVWR